MKILTLAGDGIGPEITAVTVAVLHTRGLGGTLGTKAFGNALLETL